jgi:hypothetical protein
MVPTTTQQNIIFVENKDDFLNGLRLSAPVCPTLAAAHTDT